MNPPFLLTVLDRLEDASEVGFRVAEVHLIGCDFRAEDAPVCNESHCWSNEYSM